MNKTTDEIRDNLSNLKVSPRSGTDILVVTVDSPSREFAKDFADALATEYSRFLEEEAARDTGERGGAVMVATMESKRLSEELKTINQKLSAFEREHDLPNKPELAQLKGMYGDRARVQELYNTALAKLMKAEETRSRPSHNVLVLESTIVELH